MNSSDVHIDGDRWVQFSPGEWDTEVFVAADGDPAIRALTQPPADWQDPTCETCGGTAMVDHPLVTGSGVWACCPDCIDGLRRIAVTEPCELRRRCPVCHGHGDVIGRHAWDGHVMNQVCPRCRGRGDVPCEHVDPEFPVGLVVGPCDCNDGLLAVANVVQDWGPAIVSRTHVEGALHVVEMQTHDGPQWFVCDCDEMCEPLTLPPDVDPASLVGQWARGGRVVTS